MGKILRVARLAPTVAYETFRTRLFERDASATKMGPPRVFLSTSSRDFADQLIYHLFQQVITFGKDDYPSILKPETSKHISFMPCINAVREESTPIVVFEGVRALARFIKEYSGVLLAMDPAGHMSCEIFLA